MKMYNRYRLTVKKHNDPEVIVWVDGESLDEAIKHSDFWYEDGDKLADDYDIIEAELRESTDDYPYWYEGMVRFAFENKLSVIKSIMDSDMADFDKETLIVAIASEKPEKFLFLDTMCRDLFIDEMEFLISAPSQTAIHHCIGRRINKE